MNQTLARAADHRDLRLGVISNPQSGRNRRQIDRVRALLDAEPDVPHFITAGPDDIPRGVAAFRQQGINLIAINGGDGSVAHALVALASSNGGPTPLLCALPGGTTNVTVNDVGIRGRLLPALRTLLDFARSGNPRAHVVERHVIGVSTTTGALLGCGLVFGTGAVVDGIEYWQQQVRARGMRSELSSGVAMLRTLWGMLRGDSDFARPLAMRLQCDDIDAPENGLYRLLVISGLQRLFLGIHPFWGRTDRALYCTAIEQRAAGFAGALPGILRGRPGARVTAANGYHSACIDSMRLDFRGSYTLDGELHRVGADEAPLTVGAVGRARFLRIR